MNDRPDGIAMAIVLWLVIGVAWYTHAMIEEEHRLGRRMTWADWWRWVKGSTRCDR